jgi:arsenate reductase
MMCQSARGNAAMAEAAHGNTGISGLIWRDGRCGVNLIRLTQARNSLPITIYGIKNCDTMKKARAWLDGHGVGYDFHDYKIAGIAKEKLKQWSEELGWETLLNRSGTTFRKLPDADKAGLNEKKALALMQAQPSMIRRPVLDLGGKLLVGFKPEIYAKEVRSSAVRTFD